MIKREKPLFTAEQDILLAAIISTRFIQAIRNFYDSRLITNQVIRKLLDRILSYEEKYRKAPGRDIKGIYEHEVEPYADENQREIIETILERVAVEIEQKAFNYAFYKDKAIQYFQTKELEIQIAKAEELKKKGRLIEAEAILKQVDIKKEQTSIAIEVFTESNFLDIEDTENASPLFEFDGVAGELFGGPICREWLMGFVAPPGVGKTQWLIETAFCSVMAQNRTVFISLEMGHRDIIERFALRFLGQPIRPPRGRKRFTVNFPVLFCENSEHCELPIKGLEACKTAACEGFEPGIKHKLTVKKYDEKSKANLKERFIELGMLINPYLRVISYPSFQATMSDIHRDIKLLAEYEQFVPDVIIIDYLDIVRPDFFAKQERHNLDRLWKQAKGIGAELHAAVASASQSNREGAKKKHVEATDIAEDYRKVGHVDILAILQQQDKEARDGVKRMYRPKHRHRKKDTREAVILECPELGMAYLDGYLIERGQ